MRFATDHKISSPPPAHNLAGVPIARRGPCDDSVPGSVDDFLPQSQP